MLKFEKTTRNFPASRCDLNLNLNYEKLISTAKVLLFSELCKKKGEKVWFGGDF